MNTDRVTKLVFFIAGAILLVFLAVAMWLPQPDPVPPTPPDPRVTQLQGRMDTLQGDVVRLQLQLAELKTTLHTLQAQPPGMTGPEVRALLEMFLPEPVLPPEEPAP